MDTSKKHEGDGRQPKVVSNKLRKMESKVRKLNKRYPESHYEIQEDTDNRKGEKIYIIARTKGIRPHKKKGWRHVEGRDTGEVKQEAVESKA